MAATGRPSLSARAGLGGGSLAVVLLAALLLLLPLASCTRRPQHKASLAAARPGDGAAAAAAAADAADLTPACSKNLLKNGGAETMNTDGTFPGWSTGNITRLYYGFSDFPAPAISKKIKGETYFFLGAPGAAIGAISQRVSVGSCISCSTPTYANLSAFLGGYLTDKDYATVTASFLSATKSLGSLTIGPVTLAERKSKTALLFRSRVAKVPCGTKTIRVTLRAERKPSNNDVNDGYADNLSLRLQSKK